MAKVYITVWDNAFTVALGDPLQHDKATIGGTNSAAITGSNRLRRRCRLFAEAACWVKWGAAPTATGEDDAIPLGANNPEYFDIEAGYVVTAITR